jgi:hypothetical protein
MVGSGTAVVWLVMVFLDTGIGGGNFIVQAREHIEQRCVGISCSCKTLTATQWETEAAEVEFHGF